MPPPKKKPEEKRWNPTWDPQPPKPVDVESLSQFVPCEAGLHWIARYNKACKACELGAPQNIDSSVLSEVRAAPQKAVPKGRPIEDLPSL